MNAYYTNTNTRNRRYERRDSDAIRRAYIVNTRKKEFSALIGSLAASIDSKTILNLILAIKIISGILCAVGFLSVICLIEAGSLSIISGLVATAIIAAIECLCFVPTTSKEKNNY